MKKLLGVLLIFFCLTSCERPEFPEYEGLSPAKKKGRWGYINVRGEEKIAFKFDMARYFTEGRAAVKLKDKWGFIDSNGNVIIKPKFDQVNDFSDSLAVVIKNRYQFEIKTVLDRNGNELFTIQAERLDNFSEDLALFRKEGGNVSYIDRSGEIVITTDYPYGEGFKGGMAKLWDGDFKSVFINTKNEKIEFKSNSLIYDPSYDDEIDYNEIEKFEFIGGFSEGLAPFYTDSGSGFINKAGEVIKGVSYTSVDGFRNGLSKVRKGAESGYVNHDFEWVWKDEKDLAYRDLNISAWNPDTLEVYRPSGSGKYAGTFESGRYSFDNDQTFKIRVDTTDFTILETPFQTGVYLARKIFVLNNSSDTIQVELQDGLMEIRLQAMNENKEWQFAEMELRSFCGNSYYDREFPPGFGKIVSAPFYKGDFATKLRYCMKQNDQLFYSNTFSGMINKEQLVGQKQ